MTIGTFLTIGAVLGSPLLAVQVTKYLEANAERRSRRIKVYRPLMTTQAQRLSLAHVEALNSIDLEFTQRGYKAVREAWKALLAHFSDQLYPANQTEQWAIKHIDLHVDPLFEMGNRLGYQFDKTHLKTGAYSPEAYGDFEEDQAAIRKGVRRILEGNIDVPVCLKNEKNDPD